MKQNERLTNIRFINFIAPSVPTSFAAVAASSHAVFLSWRPPTFPNGLIRGYSILYSDESFGRGRQLQLLVHPTDLLTITIIDLLPNRIYRLAVRAKTEEPAGNDLWGNYSSAMEVRTLSSAPSSSPTVTDARAQGSESVLISWKVASLILLQTNFACPIKSSL